MFLTVSGSTATTLRQAGYSAVGFVADDAVGALDVGQEFGEEEGFVLPAGHVEVAVPVVVVEAAAGVGRHDNHFDGFAGGHELVGNLTGVSAPEPGFVGVSHAVQKVEDGVLPVRLGFVAFGQVDGVLAVGVEDLAVHTLVEDFALRWGEAPRPGFHADGA